MEPAAPQVPPVPAFIRRGLPSAASGDVDVPVGRGHHVDPDRDGNQHGAREDHLRKVDGQRLEGVDGVLLGPGAPLHGHHQECLHNPDHQLTALPPKHLAAKRLGVLLLAHWVPAVVHHACLRCGRLLVPMSLGLNCVGTGATRKVLARTHC